MRRKYRVKEILTDYRRLWDRPDFPSEARYAFDRMTKCGTLALGAEIFGSETDCKVVPHT